MLWIAQTTVGGEDEARQLAQRLVEDRLTACVHIEGPLLAVYRWKGNVESAPEWRVSLKTTSARLPALRSALFALHPYDTPEWIAWRLEEVDPDYLAWARKQVSPAGALFPESEMQ